MSKQAYIKRPMAVLPDDYTGDLPHLVHSLSKHEGFQSLYCRNLGVNSARLGTVNRFLIPPDYQASYGPGRGHAQPQNRASCVVYYLTSNHAVVYLTGRGP